MNEYQLQIKKLFEKYPKHFSKMIFSNSTYENLKKWINENCDILSPDNLTKIYTAYSSERLLCPCLSGKLRKCYRFNNGLTFCGKNCLQNKIMSSEKRKNTNIKKYNGSAPACDPLIMDKIKKTNLEKYGNEYAIASIDVKEKIKKINMKKYNCPNVSSNRDIQQKRIQSNFKKYGCEHPSSTRKFREKVKNTNIKKLGVDNPMKNVDIRNNIKHRNLIKYGVESPKQQHYSQLARDILFDKDKFERCLKENGIQKMSEMLGVADSTLYVRHAKLGLNVISSSSSSYESEIANWLEKQNICFIQREKSIIHPYELDFYIPDFKLAIEFDGLYWHSEAQEKDNLYHKNKTVKCAEKGIRLIHIFEDEWIEHKNVCQDIISRVLNLNKVKIMARKCHIKEMANNECKEFLNENHLQGYASASINLGLFYENKLVQLLTFKHSRYNKHVEWENIRQVSKLDIQVTGGIQKLWSYFIKKYNPDSVVSYCDRRWFTGESYQKLGFNLKSITRPQYWYICYMKHHWKRCHRTLFTKKKCIEKAILLTIYSRDYLEKLTEKIIAVDILNINRIWDCGQQTWIWKNHK